MNKRVEQMVIPRHSAWWYRIIGDKSTTFILVCWFWCWLHSLGICEKKRMLGIYGFSEEKKLSSIKPHFCKGKMTMNNVWSLTAICLIDHGTMVMFEKLLLYNHLTCNAQINHDDGYVLSLQVELKVPIILEEFIEYTPIIIKQTRRMWTCNRLDLQTLGCGPVMPMSVDVYLRYYIRGIIPLYYTTLPNYICIIHHKIETGTAIMFNSKQLDRQIAITRDTKFCKWL